MSNPLMFRYPPNYRFLAKEGFSKQVEIEKKIVTYGESVTDKESYRLSLAGKRGALISALGTNNTGVYSFPDGKYDPLNDFSYIRRKDISIVEIDNYIENMKSNLEKADEQLAKQITDQIAKAQKAKEEIAAKEKSTQDLTSGE